MNPPKVDTSSVLAACFFAGVVLVPLAVVLLAGYLANHPKEQPVTLRDQYPDDHLGI